MITLIVFVALLVTYVLVIFFRGVYREKRKHMTGKEEEILEED
jgi:hypothetical protein